MTNFEKDYLMSRQKFIIPNGTENNIMKTLSNQRAQFNLQMNYKQLDRLVMELEQELSRIKMLRIELEKYGVEFNLQVENEAVKKVQEVANCINNLLK